MMMAKGFTPSIRAFHELVASFEVTRSAWTTNIQELATSHPEGQLVG